MLEIGVSTNNECGENIREVLTNIKAAGFKNIMLAFKTGDIEQSFQIAGELGLKIPFVHLSQSNSLWARGENNRRFMETLKHQIELAGQHGVPIAILHATQGRAEEFALPPNQFGLDCIEELVKFARIHNVKIALENLDKPSFKHFAFVMENIKDKNLGFCYDAGHHQLYNPRTDLLRRYGDRILAIHLHDNLMDWSFGYDYTRDLHRLPFDGKIDYKKIIKKLAATRYNNVVMLEIHKHSSGEPHIYDQMSNLEFLKEAKLRAERIANMIDLERREI